MTTIKTRLEELKKRTIEKRRLVQTTVPTDSCARIANENVSHLEHHVYECILLNELGNSDDESDAITN